MPDGYTMDRALQRSAERAARAIDMATELTDVVLDSAARIHDVNVGTAVVVSGERDSGSVGAEGDAVDDVNSFEQAPDGCVARVPGGILQQNGDIPERDIPMLAQLAFDDPQTIGNPRDIDVAGYEQIYRSCFV